MAFLENTQVQEQFQVPTPQVDDPPKKKKLWDYMTKKRLYTKSYEDFDTQFSTPEKVSKLYNFLTEKKQYTKTEDDFVNQFFEDVKKKEPAQPIQQPKEAVTTPTIQPSKETAKTSTNGAATQEPTNIPSQLGVNDGKKRGEFVTGDILSDPTTNEPYQIQNGEKVYAKLGETKDSPIPLSKEKQIEQPKEDVITLAKQADDLGKKTIQLPTNGGMMGTAPTEMPDENAIAQSKELKAKIKQQGYDADELNEAFKDFPEDLFNRKEYSKEKLLVLNKTNKNDFYRTVASAKWQSILLNAIKSLPQDDRRTKTALADWNSFLKNQQLAKDYEGGRQHTRDIVNMVYKYVDNVDEQNKILGYLGKDLEISYDPRIKGVKEALSSDPRKKYLTDNELLGLQYYEDINPQLANTFDDVLVDGTKLDTNAWGDNVDKGEQLGLQQQKIKLATQGLSIKSNAINEEKARIAAKGVQVTPEEKEKYDKLNEQSKEVEAEIKELTNPKSKEYGKLAEYNLDGVAQELFGQRHGLAANQGLKFLSGVGGNVGSVINMVAKPFLSDEGSKVWNLGQIGQSIKSNKNTYTTQENSLMQHFAVEETPAFTQQKNAILNDPNLTDEQKIQKGVELLSNNDGWQLVAPSKELNAGIMPLIYGIADTANGLGQFILTSTLLKGVPALSGATKASNFANIFASTFLQSFQPKLTANLTNNEEYPTAKAFLSSSIDGILFGAADKAGVIKKMFSPKSSIGKVINELSDAELNNIIKISKSGNVFKDILNAALSSAKHATPMVAAGVGGSIANDYINNDLKKAEEYFKEGLMQQAMFTLLGVPMGAMGKRGERKDAAKIAQELIDKRKQVDPTFGVTVEMPSEVAKQREGEVITTQPKEYTPETKKSGVTVILPKQNEGEIITTKAVTEKPTESTQSQSTEKESGVVTEPIEVSENEKQGEVTDIEYSDFIDKGKVSEERLNDIANKVKKQEQLSDREKEIFADKTAEVNKIIAKEEVVPTKESNVVEDIKSELKSTEGIATEEKSSDIGVMKDVTNELNKQQFNVGDNIIIRGKKYKVSKPQEGRFVYLETERGAKKILKVDQNILVKNDRFHTTEEKFLTNKGDVLHEQSLSANKKTTQESNVVEGSVGVGGDVKQIKIDNDFEKAVTPFYKTTAEKVVNQLDKIFGGIGNEIKKKFIEYGGYGKFLFSNDAKLESLKGQIKDAVSKNVSLDDLAKISDKDTNLNNEYFDRLKNQYDNLQKAKNSLEAVKKELEKESLNKERGLPPQKDFYPIYDIIENMYRTYGMEQPKFLAEMSLNDLLDEYSKLDKYIKTKEADLKDKYTSAITTRLITDDFKPNVNERILKAVEQSLKETTKAETPTTTQESNVPVSEKTVQENETFTKREQPKKVSQSLRDKAKQVREQGVNKAFNLPEAKLPDGTQQAGFGGKGLNEAIAKSLEIVADGIDAGKEILDAAKEGFENIKAYYKENAKSFDEKILRDKFIDNIAESKEQAEILKKGFEKKVPVSETKIETIKEPNKVQGGYNNNPPLKDETIVGDGSSEDMTKMANAINDAHVEGKFGVDALDKVIAKMQDTDIKKIYETVKAKIIKGTINVKEVRDRLMTTKQGSEADQAVLMYDLANLKGKEKELTKEINAETNPDNVVKLQKQLMDVQNEMMDNALANRSIGRTASSIFRLRQLWVNKEMDISDMQQEYMAANNLKDLTPEQKKLIETQHAAIREARVKLDLAKEELDKALEENAKLKIENEKLEALKKDATTQKKADRAKKSDEAIAKSKEREAKVKEDLKQLRQGLNDVTRVLPKTALALSKLAAEKVYQGIVKFDELVKNVYDDVKDIFPDWTEKDVARHLLAKFDKDGNEIIPPNSQRYLDSKELPNKPDANLKEKIAAYEEAQKYVALKQFEWQKDRRMDMNKNMPLKDRIIDSILRWQRFAVLSYPTTIVKLAAVVAHQLTLKPLKFGMQYLASLATPESIKSKQSIWGDPKLSSLAKYYSTFIKNFALANLKEQFKGIDTKELLYGKPMMYDEWNAAKGLLEMPGRSHGYIKSFIKNPEFAFAHEQQINFHLSKMAELQKKMDADGISDKEKAELKKQYDENDVTNEDVMERINKLSLEHAKWGIMMNENKFVDKFQKFTKDSGITGALVKSELPIVKIPLNYIGRAFATKYGLIKAVTGSKWYGGNLPSAFSLIKNGTKDLTEAQANLLGQTLTLGSIGASFFALGYMNRNNVKVNDDGSVDLFGTHFSKNLTHSPEFESFFSGAETGKRYKDKGKDGVAPWLTAFVQSDIDIAKKNPFANMLTYGFVPQVATALLSKKDPDEISTKITKAVAKKFTDMSVPGFVKQPAQWIDTKEKGIHPMGEPIKRTPQGTDLEKAWQTFELAIPLLRENVPMKGSSSNKRGTQRGTSRGTTRGVKRGQ